MLSCRNREFVHVAYNAVFASIFIWEGIGFESSIRIEVDIAIELTWQIDRQKRSCIVRGVTIANWMGLKNSPITIFFHRKLSRKDWATTGDNGIVMPVSLHSKVLFFPVQMALLNNEADIKRQISAVYELYNTRKSLFKRWWPTFLNHDPSLLKKWPITEPWPLESSKPSVLKSFAPTSGEAVQKLFT